MAKSKKKIIGLNLAPEILKNYQLENVLGVTIKIFYALLMLANPKEKKQYISLEEMESLHRVEHKHKSLYGRMLDSEEELRNAYLIEQHNITNPRRIKCFKSYQRVKGSRSKIIGIEFEFSDELFPYTQEKVKFYDFDHINHMQWKHSIRIYNYVIAQVRSKGKKAVKFRLDTNTYREVIGCYDYKEKKYLHRRYNYLKCEVVEWIIKDFKECTPFKMETERIRYVKNKPTGIGTIVNLDFEQ